MCGRLVARVLKKAWTKDGRIVIPPIFRPSYNIAPTQGIIVFRAGETEWDASLMRWGLVPSWWKDAAKLPGQTFNARAETLAEKPTFRAAFKRRRCLIPCDGFYEWKGTGGKVKQPFFVHPADPEGIFHFAGLWDLWETADGAMESCTIITTEPNALMAEIHNRMPVILSPEHFDEWLDPTNHQDSARLQRLLVPCEPLGMEACLVGPVKGDGPQLIEPLA
jgi:putative SOS response-associated peptidase YedK